MEHPENTTAPLYQHLATEITRLIEHGTFRVGERVPSVRGLSRQKSVSISTVLEAYRLLEDRGFIEARPQSGYFVRPRMEKILAEPNPSTPPRVPCCVRTGELISMILRQAHEPGIVNLGAAVPDAEILPLDRLGRALSGAARRSLRRPFDPPPGTLELRTQVARRAMTAGYAVTPDDVLITNGCQEAVTFALRATCRPGDTVAVESPTFFCFLEAIRSLGLRVLELPTHPSDGASLPAIEGAITRHRVRAILLVPSFGNPLGHRMPEEKRKELAALVARHEVPLIEDDLNGDLPHGPERPRAVKAFDRKDLVILCSSFSKTLAPNYRVGWMIPGRFASAVEEAKIVTNLTTSTLPQLAIAEFLANGGYDRHLRKVRRIYAQRIACMTQAIAELFPPGTRATRPTGGYIAWVEFPEGVDTLRLYEQALQEGITIAPGPLFSAKGAYRNCCRLNAALWSDRTPAALSTLNRLAMEQLGHPRAVR